MRKARLGVDIDLGVCSCGLGKKWWLILMIEALNNYRAKGVVLRDIYGIELTKLGYWY